MQQGDPWDYFLSLTRLHLTGYTKQSLPQQRKFVMAAQMVKKFKPTKKHEGYYRVQKISTLVSILSHLSSIHALLFNFLKGTLKYYPDIKSSLLQVATSFRFSHNKSECISVLYVLHVLPISSLIWSLQ
jgi:hypothetical protein